METLQCPVCFHTFNSEENVPLVLSCGHTFCQNCINSMERRMGALNCPHCRGRDYREVSQMKKNILVLQQVGAEKPKLIAPCPQHSRVESQFFCLTCNCPFCSKCVTKHKTHDFYDLDDPVITQGTDKQLEELLRKAERMLENSQTQRERVIGVFGVVEDKLKAAKEQVNNAFEPLVKALNKKREEFIMSLNEPCNQLIKNVQSHVEECDDVIQKRQKIISEIENTQRQVNWVAGPERVGMVQRLSELPEEETKDGMIQSLEQEAASLELPVSIETSYVLESINSLEPQQKQLEKLVEWTPGDVPVFHTTENNPRQVRLVEELVRSGIAMSERIKEVLMSIDRKDFVPSESHAYEDRPQRIGFNTTVSAPHMHAMTLCFLEDYLHPGQSVLDIGCGSGYLTVCLAKMIGRGKVYGVDHIEELINQAVDNIRKNNLHLIQKPDLELRMICRDGRLGLEDYGPFDVIHIGAATPEIPAPLVEQLKVGGILMAPVGHIQHSQQITIVKKNDNGTLEYNRLMSVSYAPLTDRARQCP